MTGSGQQVLHGEHAELLGHRDEGGQGGQSEGRHLAPPLLQPPLLLDTAGRAERSLHVVSGVEGREVYLHFTNELLIQDDPTRLSLVISL